MVTGARRDLVNGRPTSRQKPYRDDVESAQRNGLSARSRFKDLVGSVIADGRRKKMQARLKQGVDNSHLESYRKSREELKAIKNKKVRKFYEAQNDRLDDWLEVDSLVQSICDDIYESFDPHDEDGDGVAEIGGALQATHGDIEPLLPEEERKQRQKDRKVAKWAININVVANVFLLIAKIVAAFFSSSLSLIASLVDSALDLLCTLIVYTTSKLVQMKIKSLSRRFPIGRRRLEPLGILVFSVIMVISFLEILKESFEKLLPSAAHKTVTLPPAAIFAMLSTVVIKGIIGIGCVRIKTSQVQALAQDCKTDVIFNTVSLLFPLIGKAASIWWLDPVGAGLLSLFIIYDWSMTCLEQVARLTGVGVEQRIERKLMYMVWRFSPVVDAYKSITAYHAGDGVWCEVDLLLDEKTPLEHAHDVAETLQYCLEGLNEVDRAFVSVDYASQGPTGHNIA